MFLSVAVVVVRSQLTFFSVPHTAVFIVYCPQSYFVVASYGPIVESVIMAVISWNRICLTLESFMQTLGYGVSIEHMCLTLYTHFYAEFACILYMSYDNTYWYA